MLRSSFSTSLLHGLATAILLSSATVAGDWVAYMNVFENAGGSQGAYVFGNNWGPPLTDVKTTVITSNPGTIVGDQLRLQPNYNTYTNALTGRAVSTAKPSSRHQPWPPRLRRGLFRQGSTRRPW